MKKLFLLAVLSAVVCGAAAHPNHIFGVRVGMNIANMTFNRLNYESFEEPLAGGFQVRLWIQL